MLVFGTRPEAIKMAPLIILFKKHHTEFKTIICVTGQHRQMLDQVLTLFEITPDYDLDIMQPDQDLFDVTSLILLGIRDILKKAQPDLVFVQGDTTTSTATALAAFYQHIPVAHIEAGLRTNNIYSPFPEELNRQLTGRIATYHFAATQLSKQNLIKENVLEEYIIVTGNTVIDALHWITNKIRVDTKIESFIMDSLNAVGYDLNRLIYERRLILITGHRRESFGNGFQNICYAIRNLAIKYPDVDFVYPVHLNPNVQKTVLNILPKNQKNKNIFLIEPLDYLTFVYLMSKSYLLLTDSGGIQEEAPGLGKPVVVMRDTTERPEAVEEGTAILVGSEMNNIEDVVSRLLDDKKVYISMAHAENPYGDGRASKRIVDYFINHYHSQL